MCGIIGYVGNRNATAILISGLESLEYRGYDSAGITVVNDNEIKTIKAVGKIANLKQRISDLTLDSNIGIGHTRWATHGEPTETNSHPHQVGKVTLVHNGIIENYISLKQELINSGYQFKSATDTEVAAALIDYFYDGDPIATLTKAIEKLGGSYALTIIFNDYPDTLYCVRKDSPLVLGVGDNENFISSDVLAFLEYTNKKIKLKEKTIAAVTKNEIKLYQDNQEITPVIEIETNKAETIQKGSYAHFMAKEMNEQPRVLNDLINKYLTDNQINDMVFDLSKYNDIHIVACGSAYHAGLVGKHLLHNYAQSNQHKINVTAEVASEYRYSKQYYDDETLVIVISQSGETADTLACLRMANDNNVDTLAIVNVPTSAIANEAKYVMPTIAGPEIAVATTKGYFSQVALMALLALKKSEQQQTMTPSEVTDTINELKNTSTILKQLLSDEEHLQNIASKIYNEDDIFFIGRGLDYAICLEGSLKLKEIAYINSNTYAAGELKHGPIALIANGTPVIASVTNPKMMEKTISNIKEVKSRGAHVVLITTDEINDLIPQDGDPEVFYDDKVVIPQASEFNQTLSAIIPLQMLAYYIAEMNGCDIDKPKNLAKSVTVE